MADNCGYTYYLNKCLIMFLIIYGRDMRCVFFLVRMFVVLCCISGVLDLKGFLILKSNLGSILRLSLFGCVLVSLSQVYTQYVISVLSISPDILVCCASHNECWLDQIILLADPLKSAAYPCFRFVHSF